jgi:LysR family hydrogen peroxide-inducible transcriptional activator
LPYELKGLNSLKFWEEDFYWVSHDQNKLAGRSEIKASELEQSQLMLLEDGHCLKDHILDACNISSSSKYSYKSFKLEYINSISQRKDGNNASA